MPQPTQKLSGCQTPQNQQHPAKTLLRRAPTIPTQTSPHSTSHPVYPRLPEHPNLTVRPSSKPLAHQTQQQCPTQSTQPNQSTHPTPAATCSPTRQTQNHQTQGTRWRRQSSAQDSTAPPCRRQGRPSTHSKSTRPEYHPNPSHQS